MIKLHTCFRLDFYLRGERGTKNTLTYEKIKPKCISWKWLSRTSQVMVQVCIRYQININMPIQLGWMHDKNTWKDKLFPREYIEISSNMRLIKIYSSVYSAITC